MAKDKLIKEVKHEADGDQKWMDEQNAALMHYRVTGEAGVYVDPTRDQEPDIAPELGVAPHPDLANPAPAEGSFSGRALDPKSNPMVKPAEEKEEDAKEATEAFNEALAAREEAVAELRANAGKFDSDAQAVYLVDAPEAVEGAPDVPQDESPKASQQSGEQVSAEAADSEED